MKKKILCFLGIIVGLVVIVAGFSMLDISTPSVGSNILFRGDFYTEIYDVTRDVGYAINRAANNICAAIGWLLIAIGSAMGLTFGYKLIDLAREQKQEETCECPPQEPTPATAPQTTESPNPPQEPTPATAPQTTESLNPPQVGYWTCVCGRTNANYVGTCGCGCTKEASKVQSEQQDEEARRAAAENAGPTANGWRCFCGAENPNYVGTCMCGVSKRDVLK